MNAFKTYVQLCKTKMYYTLENKNFNTHATYDINPTIFLKKTIYIYFSIGKLSFNTHANYDISPTK